jgi:hypothetical protein
MFQIITYYHGNMLLDGSSWKISEQDKKLEKAPALDMN